MNEPVCQGCRDRDAELALLRQQVAELQAAVRDLQARLNTNSTNSSTPPAADPLDAPPRPAKKPAARKRGAQPGHQACTRIRLPPERVTRVVVLAPTQCVRCHAPLPALPGLADPEPSWHQVIDLPPVVAEVVEYQGHTRTCPCCAHANHASIPTDLKAHCVGPALAAFCAYLRSLKVSLRGVQEILASAFGIELALGTLAHLEQQTSAALAAPHAELVAAVRAAPVKHADETGWQQAGKKQWLWVVATATYAVFSIHDNRGLAGLQAILGATFCGVLVSDRWSAYGCWDVGQRQLCWAHLKRDFQKCVDYGDAASVAVGQGGLNVVKALFEAWHLYRGGGLPEDDFGVRAGSIGRWLKGVLRRGSERAPAKVRAFCANLLALWPALWTFTQEDGVEPTNNHAERLLRRGVLWRKCAFGSQSTAGGVFVARLLSAVQTLRLQGRPVLGWLVEAVTAHRQGLPAPSLLPVG